MEGGLTLVSPHTRMEGGLTLVSPHTRMEGGLTLVSPHTRMEGPGLPRTVPTGLPNPPARVVQDAKEVVSARHS